MPEIRKGGAKEDGGTEVSPGDGAKVHYPKNAGTSEDKSGGTPSPRSDKEGLNVSIGKG
jgi:hypothetical protein